jgi:hypothetical protein
MSTTHDARADMPAIPPTAGCDVMPVGEPRATGGGRVHKRDVSGKLCERCHLEVVIHMSAAGTVREKRDLPAALSKLLTA